MLESCAPVFTHVGVAPAESTRSVFSFFESAFFDPAFFDRNIVLLGN